MTRPLAIGIAQLPSAATQQQRRDAHTAIALWGDREGYAVVETFFVTGSPIEDGYSYVVVEQMAVRLEASALLLLQVADMGAIEIVAKRARLHVRVM